MGFRVAEENLPNTAVPKRSDNARFNFLFSVMPGEAFVSGFAACSRCLKHIYTQQFVLYSVCSWWVGRITWGEKAVGWQLFSQNREGGSHFNYTFLKCWKETRRIRKMEGKIKDWTFTNTNPKRLTTNTQQYCPRSICETWKICSAFLSPAAVINAKTNPMRPAGREKPLRSRLENTTKKWKKYVRQQNKPDARD